MLNSGLRDGVKYLTRRRNVALTDLLISGRRGLSLPGVPFSTVRQSPAKQTRCTYRYLCERWLAITR